MEHRTLNAKELVVVTASIEVHVMKMTNRQLTLSVYRQIPKEFILDDALNLKGKPWGWVNYCPSSDECEHGQPHRHVVWQKGVELRRCTIGLTWNPQALIDPEELKNLAKEKMAASKPLDPCLVDKLKTLKHDGDYHYDDRHAEYRRANGEWLREVEACYKTLLKRSHECFEEIMKELKDIPQLYIAV